MTRRKHDSNGIRRGTPYTQLQSEEYWKFVSKVLGYSALFAAFSMLVFQVSCGLYDCIREQNRYSQDQPPTRPAYTSSACDVTRILGLGE